MTDGFVSFRSADESRNRCLSGPCPGTTSEHEQEDNRDPSAPLNLSTRNQDKEKIPPDHRLHCSEDEELKGEELPLNLSLHPSHGASVPSSALKAPENCLQRPDTEQDEEPCDQRQTAALALCQLATAGSVISLPDSHTAEQISENSIDTGSHTSEKPDHTMLAIGMKRANSGQAKSHRPKKRAKVPGRAVRRRPRCC